VNAKRALALILVVAIGLLLFGCDIGVVPVKTTGGGWFTDEDGHRVTFGFTAHPGDNTPAKGQFQLVDHGNKTVEKMKIHGNFTVAADWVSFDEQGDIDDCTWFSGNCTVNGMNAYPFAIKLCDYGEPGPSSGDRIELGVGTDENNPDWSYEATLEGGNIQIHWPNPNKPNK
jgi:hypothetical protein